MATKGTADPFAPQASYRLLESYESTLTDHQRLLLSKQFRTALDRFEALAGKTIVVGRMPPSKETILDPIARAQPWNMLVEFQPGETPSNMTLFHELAHLAIHVRDENGESVPTSSEEFCSLFALSKMEPGDIFAKKIPYLGEPEAPSDQWPEIARDALEYRERRGYNSHYVQRAREWFEEGLR